MTEISQPARNGFAAYVAVTAAYWAFMLTDGALRMLVLLHFHTLGFSPIQLAYLFLLYEFMGVVTNLSAGWIAARFGLTSTLYAGLILQIGALVALAQLDLAWGMVASVVFVMAVQGVSGVAKDLAKMSSKSAVKILAPQGDGALFRWVAALTGSKNAVKGIGFFIGAALLRALPDLRLPSSAWAAGLGAILIAIAVFMPSGLPRGSKKAKFSEVFSKDANINRLSAARLFLFGARDTWFVVGVPVYFYAVLSDGTVAGNRAAFFQIGAFMAVWIIGYGLIQAIAPKIPGRQGRAGGPDHRGGPVLGGRIGADPGGPGGGGLGGGRRGLADAGAGRGPAGLWGCLRAELGPAFLPDPGVLQRRAGHDGRGLLLYVERRRAAGRHASVGAEFPGRWLALVPGHRGGDAGGKLVVRRPAGARMTAAVGSGRKLRVQSRHGVQTVAAWKPKLALILRKTPTPRYRRVIGIWAVANLSKILRRILPSPPARVSFCSRPLFKKLGWEVGGILANRPWARGRAPPRIRRLPLVQYHVRYPFAVYFIQLAIG